MKSSPAEPKFTPSSSGDQNHSRPRGRQNAILCQIALQRGVQHVGGSFGRGKATLYGAALVLPCSNRHWRRAESARAKNPGNNKHCDVPLVYSSDTKEASFVGKHCLDNRFVT